MRRAVSSRQQEKERRKQERLLLEREAAAREKRRRVIQISAAALVAVAVIAGAVLAAGGGEDSGGSSDNAAGSDGVPLPPKRTEDLQAAVKAAGCTLEQLESAGQNHVADSTPLKFQSNPPTSGDHFAVAAEDGVYAPGNEPLPGNWLHSLEHGRVLFQYRPGTPARRIGQLETLFNESYSGGPDGYHTLLLRNNTRMPFAVAAVSWTRYVGCDRLTDRSFDALRAFRAEYVDKAPEQVP